MIWVALGLMTLVAVALLVLPFLWPEKGVAAGQATFDLAVYRDQLAELDRGLARGLTGADEARAARIEIERRILNLGETGPEAGEPPPPSPGRSRWPAAAALAVAIPALAVPLYLKLGAPGLPDQPFAVRQVELDVEREKAMQDREMMAQAIEQLAERLRAEPGRQERWLLLARSYRALGHYADAAEAFRRALALGPAPNARSQLAEVLVLEAQGAVGPEAVEQLQRAITADPEDRRARFYLGVARMQASDLEGALESWRALLADTPADAAWLPMLKEQIARAAERLGVEPATAGPAAKPPTETGLPEGAAAVRALPEGERKATIRGMVEGLTRRLADDPSNAEGWLHLGRSYGILDEPGEALAVLEKAKEHHPGDSRILLAFAFAAAEAAPGSGPLGAAVDDALRTVLAMEPGNVEALWLMGLAEARAGRKAEAEGHWRTLLEQLPEDHPARAGLEQGIKALEAR